MQKTVLLADENPVERQLLARMLPDCFSVCQVKTGEQVLEKISRSGSGICAVILLLSVQQPSAYEVLRRIAETPAYESLPVLALAREGTQEQERTALRAGAWDYIAAPFEPEVLFLRLGNALERGAAAAGRAMRCLSQYDSLTGLYNKTHFFEAVRSMLLLRPDLRYVMLRFDVVRFQLVNTFFGAAEGDRVLRYLAKSVRELVRPCAHAAYGRMEADVFAVCVPYDEAGTLELLRALRARLAAYNTNYDILPACGLYIVEDNTMPPAQMYTCAALAAKHSRGNWENYYAFYTPEMHEVLVREQEISNEMRSALEGGQFIFYLQPQYNLQTGYPCGAEALVRWNHPQKGIVGPGEFIPVFEQNGFITRLDRYLWEQVCRRLRAWLDAGQKPYPISVNVSRVDVYNPHLYEELTGLVEQYGVPPRLMPLELTESAYADNPDALREVLVRLHQYGFPIHMDDFGSGYSSLNFLKDITLRR